MWIKINDWYANTDKFHSITKDGEQWYGNENECRVALTSKQVELIVGKMEKALDVPAEDMPTIEHFRALYVTGVFSMPVVKDGKFNKTTIQAIQEVNSFRKNPLGWMNAQTKDHKIPVDGLELLLPQGDMSWDDLVKYLVDVILPVTLKLEASGTSYRTVAGKVGKYSLREFFIRDHGTVASSPYLKILAHTSTEEDEESMRLNGIKSRVPEECRPWIDMWVNKGKAENGRIWQPKHAFFVYNSALKLINWYAVNNERLNVVAKSQAVCTMWPTMCGTLEHFLKTLWQVTNDSFRSVGPAFIPNPVDESRWARVGELLKTVDVYI